jgi:1-acyl-sn-glycerol-3-phosphate acyltransferase
MYFILKTVARLLVFLLLNYEVKGKENIPGQGQLLIVSNHVSVSDSVLVGISIGRRVTFMAKEELFRNGFTSYFIRSFGAFPVYRGRSARDALRQASRVLNHGGVLCMFPEGKRSIKASLMPAMNGAALVASYNRSPILPVGITGSEAIRGFGWIWRRQKVTLTIGRPFYLPDAGHDLKKEQLPELTGFIMRNIAELLPEKQRGKYSGW